MILFVILWLLAVFLFFLSLHLFGKKFSSQVDQTTQILVTRDPSKNYVMNLRKGLDPCTISEIPRFVFQDEEQGVGQWHGSECVICLSSFENGQVGRRLSSCNHAFHVECIDMWLQTHTTCPICRASAVRASSLPEDEVGPEESAQRPSYSRRRVVSFPVDWK